MMYEGGNKISLLECFYFNLLVKGCYFANRSELSNNISPKLPTF